MRMKEILQFTRSWMDLEGMMHSDVSQMEKEKYCMISVMHGI